ncbi:MAG: mechanosensitive ion channel [bacterium]|nr:mechanosensitive ion channel [bacterium]
MDSILDAFSKPIMNAWPRIPGALIALVVGYIALIIINHLVKFGFSVIKTPRAVKQIFLSVVNILLWAILLALVFQSLGLPQVALALSGSVAIFGVLLATGANYLVSDILSGLFLTKDPDFKIGQKIKTVDVEGLIEYIDIRKVRIRDNEGNLHVIPNSVLDKGPFVVLDDNKK